MFNNNSYSAKNALNYHSILNLKQKSNSITLYRFNRNKTNSLDHKSFSNNSTTRNSSKFPSSCGINKRGSDQRVSLNKMNSKLIYLRNNKYIRKNILMNQKNKREEDKELSANYRDNSFNKKQIICIDNKINFIKTHLTVKPIKANEIKSEINISMGKVNLNDLAQGISPQYRTKLIEENGEIYYKYDLSKDKNKNDRISHRKPGSNSREIIDLINGYNIIRSLDRSFVSNLNRKFNQIDIKKDTIYNSLKNILDNKKKVELQYIK